MNDERFDHLLDEMRDESLATADAENIKTRVRHQLGLPTMNDPEQDFPAYLAGTLPQDRRLLLEDQLGRNIPLRKKFEQFRGAAKVVTIPVHRPSALRKWAPLAAAAGIVAFSLYAGRETLDAWFAPSGPRATIASAFGQTMVVLADGTTSPVRLDNPSQPAVLNEGDRIETGAGSRVVLKLNDGSQVEMNERSSLMVRAAWSGQSIQLNSGDVIVQAAKQKRGKLRVITRDTTASVKGTVFAVSAGTAGSLVSVVEGAVQVEHAGTDRLVKPGGQEGSAVLLQASSVRQAVAWSQDAEKLFTLLAEFGQIERSVAQLPSAALRTKSDLLPQLPTEILVYAAIPNVASTLRQTITIIEQRLVGSPVLRNWWTGTDGKNVRTIAENLQSLSGFLGDEVVFSLVADPANAKQQTGILLAQVKSGQADALRAAIAKLGTDLGSPIAYQIQGNILVASGTTSVLPGIVSQLGKGTATDFRTEIQARYSRGVAWLLGVNLEKLLTLQTTNPRNEIVGFNQARFGFFEQESVNGVDSNESVLSFRGARVGIASWLANPASGAAAEYISADAIAAASFVTKTPRQAYDEMVNAFSRVSPNFLTSLREFEQRTGINVGNDLAASLGTDLAVAMETVTLPSPGWTMAAEVLRPTALDESIRRMVVAINKEMEGRPNAPRQEFKQETVNGRQWSSLTVVGQPISLHWTYDRGYMVMSSDRAIALRAIATRNGGFPLIRSAKFRQQLPPAASVHYSGFVWVNTGGALTGLLAGVTNPSLKALVENREPILLAILGGTEQISAYSRNRLSSLLFDALAFATGASQNGQPAVTIKKAELDRV